MQPCQEVWRAVSPAQRRSGSLGEARARPGNPKGTCKMRGSETSGAQGTPNHPTAKCLGKTDGAPTPTGHSHRVSAGFGGTQLFCIIMTAWKLRHPPHPSLPPWPLGRVTSFLKLNIHLVL